jgi:hypothetical protein
MAFWWPLLVLAAAYALCRLLLFLIPPTVPSIDVDASDGTAPFYPIPILLIHAVRSYLLVLSEGLLVPICRSVGQGGQLHLRKSLPPLRFSTLLSCCSCIQLTLPEKRPMIHSDSLLLVLLPNCRCGFSLF